MSSSGKRIFKFRAGSTDDFDALHENYVWFSSLSSLNDPYEGAVSFDRGDLDDILRKKFLESILSEKPLNEVSPQEEAAEYYNRYEDETGTSFADYVDSHAMDSFREHHEKYKTDTAIFSFSIEKEPREHPAPLNNMLMWAHYTNGFRGYCIEFDMEKLRSSIALLNNVQLGKSQVKYAIDGALPTIKLKTFMNDILKGTTDSSIEIFKSFCYKEQSWAHENEGRFLITNCSGKLQYDPDCINSIYFSRNMPNWAKLNLISCVNRKNLNIPVFEVCLHNGKYAFGFNEIEPKHP